MIPLVSIILPSYNRANDLKRAISSVLKQSYTNFELIIIDNNSTDDTDEVISNYPDKRILLIKIDNKGLIAVSRNLGLKIAKGKYIAFLDSDDWWLENKLEISIAVLEKGYDFVHHKLYIVKKQFKYHYFLKKTNDKQISSPIFENLLYNGNLISNSSVVLRKSTIENKLPLKVDALLNSFCDYHWWLEISQITNNFKYINKALGFYWFGGGNYTNYSRSFLSISRLANLYSQNKFYKKNIWVNQLKARMFLLNNNENKATIYFLISLKNKFKLRDVFFLMVSYFKVFKNRL
jgi:glycosyltransferase involved in cell wall biosynthesis